MGAEQKNLEQILDIEKGKEGLQLPPNFEEKFKSKENRDVLVKAVNSKFENSDAIKNNKDAVIGACKKEISSWGESMPNDPGKVAVLYLYNALNGKTLYKEQLPTAFDDFKKNNKTEAVATTSEKKGEPLKEGITTIDTDIEGRKLHIKDVVEKGALKERSVDIGFKFLGDFHFDQKYENGKISSETGSVVVKDKRLFEKAKTQIIGSDYDAKFDDSSMTINIVSKNPNERKIISGGKEENRPIGENPQKIDSIEDIKNTVKFLISTIDNQERLNKYSQEDINQNMTVDKAISNLKGNPVEGSSKNTVPANLDNKINTNPTETIQLEQTEATKLQASINAIPALKSNKDINKLISDMNKLEKTTYELGNTYTSKLGEREASKTEVANKEESLNQLEAQIKDTKSIDDKFARKSALDRLYTQKDNLQKDIKDLENKRDDLKDEVDQLAIDINEIKTEIADTKDTLMSKLEPIQRDYEKNITTINTDIEKYKKALDGQYTDSQRATLKPDFEKWTEAKSSQEALLNTTKTEQGNLNTLIANLKGEKQDNNEDSNLANGGNETKNKPA